MKKIIMKMTMMMKIRFQQKYINNYNKEWISINNISKIMNSKYKRMKKMNKKIKKRMNLQ